MKNKAWIFLGTGLVIVGLTLGLALGLTGEDSENSNGSSKCVDKVNSKCFKTAAIAADDVRCGKIGENLLKKGGSAVDAIIGTLLCDGVVNPYHSGIGGATFFNVYDKQKGEALFINCREMAPKKATQDMFVGNPLWAQHGPLAIAVPGEMKCFKEAHDRFGSLPWSDLFEGAIDLARNGWEIFNHTYDTMVEKKDWLENPEYNWEAFLKEDGTIKDLGDTIVDLDFANTLEKLANDPTKDSFYNGEIAADMAEDFKDIDALLTAEDLFDYTAIVQEPLISELRGDTYYFPRAPSSGPLVQFMLNILDAYDLDESKKLDEETYHKIIESMKHAYALRTANGDPEFFPNEVGDFEKKCSDPDYINSIRANITEITHDIDYYNPVFVPIENHGTLHTSAIDGNGMAVSATTTVNLYYGCKIRGKRTKIIFNDGMDDFSTPGFDNDFGVPPSPINFVAPGKRPVSSMSPTIVVDSKTKEPKLVTGGSGGTKITTGTLQVILNKLRFGYSMGDSVNRQRIHHQLSPNELNWQDDVLDGPEWLEMIKALESKRGHKLRETGRMVGSPQTSSVFRYPDGTIEAASDPRHSGVPGGF